VQRQIARAVSREGATYELPYDYLVVALGASTNEQLIPGSSNAFTFKTMADALVLRNHLIEQFERADASPDSTMRRDCLTVVVIGGGLVGVELLGELTAFADDVLRFYPRIRRDEIRFRLFEAGPRILPEIDEALAAVEAVDADAIQALAGTIFRDDALRLAAVAPARYLRGLESRLRMPA
jgi:NADH dehydrogenase